MKGILKSENLLGTSHDCIIRYLGINWYEEKNISKKGKIAV